MQGNFFLPYMGIHGIFGMLYYPVAAGVFLVCSGFLACFIAVSGKSIFLLPATEQYMCS